MIMLTQNEIKAVVRLAFRALERRQKEQEGRRTLIVRAWPLPDEARFSEFCEMYALCDHTFAPETPPEQLLPELSLYHSLLLLSPPTQVLERLTRGEAADSLETLILDFILKQKNCALVLDYDIRALPPGQFRLRLNKLLDDAADMGFQIIRLSDALIDRDDEAIGLLTAELVDDFHRRGERVITLGEDTIVTPYAAERAQELGIKINKE